MGKMITRVLLIRQNDLGTYLVCYFLINHFALNHFAKNFHWHSRFSYFSFQLYLLDSEFF